MFAKDFKVFSVLMMFSIAFFSDLTELTGDDAVALKKIGKPDFSSKPALRQRKQPTVPKNFTENKFVDDAPEPEVLTEDKKKGFIIFNRPITQPVYRGTHPLKWERIQGLSGFATLGEYEPFTFSLYPLRVMKNLRVRVSPLRSGKSVIGKDNLDLRALIYWNIRYPRYTSTDTYRPLPELLEKVNSIDLLPKVCQRFWLKVHVPVNAKLGLYRGHITIYESGADYGFQLPISLRVLDYTLKRDPAKRYSVYYYGLKRQFKGIEGERFAQARENELKSMLTYGIDMFPTISLGESREKDGTLSVYMRDDALVNKMIKMGFKGPIPICGGIGHFYRRMIPGGKIGKHWHISKNPSDDKIYKAIEKAYRKVKLHAEKSGWPELICCPIDEPSPASADFVARVYDAVRRAGLKTYITKDPTSLDAQVFRKYDAVDAWCSQPYAVSYEKCQTDKRYAYWSYPNHNAGELKNRVIMQKGGRMTYGFGFWRSGYSTLIPWHWRWLPYREDQFDYLRGKASGCGARMDENLKIIPAVYWETFREGYDDLRYLYTLQQAIVQREGSTDKQCQLLLADGKKLIQEIWDSIEPQVKYLNTNMWADETFNARRWQMAVLTQKLLKFPAVNNNISPSVLAVTGRRSVKKDDAAFIAESLKKGVINKFDLSKDRYKNWKALNNEVTMKVLPEDSKDPSLHFNVLVDHLVDGGGEKGKYPMGWPRIRYAFKTGEMDITKYDYLYFNVKVDSNRSEVADDTTPFIISFAAYSDGVVSSVYAKGVKFDEKLDLGDKQRTWIPVVLSLRKMILRSGFPTGKWKDFSAFQLVIAESHYKHKTQMKFEIRDIALLKFSRPIIQDIDSSILVISPEKNYPIYIKGFGFEDAAKQNATIIAELIDSSGRSVVKKQIPLTSQPMFVLNFESLKLGKYKLNISVLDEKEAIVSSKGKTIEVINGYE